MRLLAFEITPLAPTTISAQFLFRRLDMHEGESCEAQTKDAKYSHKHGYVAEEHVSLHLVVALCGTGLLRTQKPNDPGIHRLDESPWFLPTTILNIPLCSK